MFFNKKWRLKKVCTDSNCTLFGVNIFEYDWIPTGEKVEVKEPRYNQTHLFSVYTAEIKGKSKRFVAGEFSNNVWGFYVFK